MDIEEKLKAIHEAIFEGELMDAKVLIRQLVEEQIDSVLILKGAIIPAIREIGESMEEGDFFMPEVKISTKVLQEVAEILRPYVISQKKSADLKIPPWTGEGDIDDIGTYLKTTIEQSVDLPVQDQMGVLDMIAAGLDTHEFTPCKIQATEADEK
jgi:methanogenic corrinoid protein MtbC1